MTGTPRLRASVPRPQPVPWVQRMGPYAAPDDPADAARLAGVPVEGVIKLDANENPYGPSPRVAEALARFSRYHRYPDPLQKDARAKVAAYARVPVDSLVLGNGSDEIIDLLCRIYLEPGDEVVDCTPTFGMYRFSAKLCAGVVVEVPRTADWGVSVAAVEQAITDRSRLIFVASPNNPSGNRESQDVVRALLETGCIVVVDEAYVEFADGQSHCRLVSEYDNLVVLRTFSKWAGLAGLRVGYGVLPPAMTRELLKIKPPFNLNLAAETAVSATLDDLPYLQAAVRRIVDERERMAEKLGSIEGICVWPSEANFVLVSLAGARGADLHSYLQLKGISVRAYTHPRLATSVRISVGLPEHTDALVKVVGEWSEAEKGA